MSQGKLYLVATPIGNLEDITMRALRLLKEVDLIACEDTRRTAKLLSHYGIHTPRESYHEHNEERRTPQLIALLQAGKTIALATDAGTPLVSDPGYTLVCRCIEAGIDVVPIPGPSAPLAALAASGLPTDRFFCAGFLAARSGPRKRQLRELASLPATLILFEAPHRLRASLQDMVDVLGSRRACMARELTKLHEEWLHGTLPEILGSLQRRSGIRGEITLVIDRGAADAAAPAFPASLRRHVEEEMLRAGTSRKEALRAAARQRGISRREAYRQLLDEGSAN